mgnify:CR=1 FL=1
MASLSRTRRRRSGSYAPPSATSPSASHAAVEEVHVVHTRDTSETCRFVAHPRHSRQPQQTDSHLAGHDSSGVTPTEADDWSVSSAGPWGGDPPEHIHTQSDEEAIAP